MKALEPTQVLVVNPAPAFPSVLAVIVSAQAEEAIFGLCEVIVSAQLIYATRARSAGQRHALRNGAPFLFAGAPLYEWARLARCGKPHEYLLILYESGFTSPAEAEFKVTAKRGCFPTKFLIKTKTGQGVAHLAEDGGEAPAAADAPPGERVVLSIAENADAGLMLCACVAACKLNQEIPEPAGA